VQCACAKLSSVVCSIVQIFFMLSHKRHDFRKKLLTVKCDLILSATVSVTFLILRGNERDMIKTVFWSS